jgi:hypothetical protein
MELAAFVALRLPPVVLRLARAKLSKVLCGLGHHVLVQLHLDPPQLLPWLLMSVGHYRVPGHFIPMHETDRAKKRAEEDGAG